MIYFQIQGTLVKNIGLFDLESGNNFEACCNAYPHIPHWEIYSKKELLELKANILKVI